MKSLRDLEKRFLITTGCFFLISVGLLFLPLCGTGETGWQKASGILVGILFWIGILAGGISYFLMYQKYKDILVKRLPRGRLPYCLRIWGNPAAMLVDLLFLIGLAGTIYCNVTLAADRILDFLALFLMVTSFYLHFLVTGRVFLYLAQKKKKGVKENERKTQA